MASCFLFWWFDMPYIYFMYYMFYGFDRPIIHNISRYDETWYIAYSFRVTDGELVPLGPFRGQTLLYLFFWYRIHLTFPL